MDKSLDNFDLQILAFLQEDAATQVESIAADIGLSPSTVQRRIQKLRKSNVIQQTCAIIDPAAIDQNITLVVEIELERERSDLIDSFKREMRSIEQVQQCYYVTGNADFVLIVTAKDMTDYEAFTRKAFYDNPNIRRFRTMVVLDRVKVGLTVPVNAG